MRFSGSNPSVLIESGFKHQIPLVRIHEASVRNANNTLPQTSDPCKQSKPFQDKE